LIITCSHPIPRRHQLYQDRLDLLFPLPVRRLARRRQVRPQPRQPFGRPAADPLFRPQPPQEQINVHNTARMDSRLPPPRLPLLDLFENWFFTHLLIYPSQ
jgi:hypothetical protein